MISGSWGMALSTQLLNVSDQNSPWALKEGKRSHDFYGCTAYSHRQQCGVGKNEDECVVTPQLASSAAISPPKAS
jgi:hypothetical protein